MKRQSLLEIARFAAAGIANTVVDFAILNALVATVGLGQGDARFAAFKAISFAAAVTQSYVLNKLWVFRAGRLTDPGAAREASSFLAVSVASMLVNVGVAALAFAAARAALPSETIAVNVGAALGTVAAVASNYVGYKFLVFRGRLAS
jgi:putative flippase GtrA